MTHQILHLAFSNTQISDLLNSLERRPKYFLGQAYEVRQLIMRSATPENPYHQD